MARTPDLAKATDFVWRMARLLERHRFAFLFLGGGRQAVLSAFLLKQSILQLLVDILLSIIIFISIEILAFAILFDSETRCPSPITLTLVDGTAAADPAFALPCHVLSSPSLALP